MSSPRAGASFISLVEIMARLRGPGGCPWDREQTLQSLARYVLEEAAEVVDAIERDDAAALCDELGDLLLNLAFQIVIAEERGDFGRSAVVLGLEEKMRRRHPHH